MPRTLIAVLLAAATIPASQARATAVVAGVVVDAAGGALAGAAVTALDERTGASRTAQTDEAGRFTVARLPPGRYVLTATLSGFLSSSYGATAPGEPGVPVSVGEAARIDGLAVTLERPATLGGRVTTRDGQAVPAAVHAMVTSWLGSDRRLRRVATARTDAAGAFELGGLWPDDYALLVTPLVAAAPGVPGEPRRSHTPVFYPGVTGARQAATIPVLAGQQIGGLDVLVDPAPVTSLTAIVASADRRPVVHVASVIVPLEIGEVGLGAEASPDPRPHVFADLTAGRYRLTASALAAGADGSLERLWAAGEAVVDGRTPVEVALDLQPGSIVEGRLVFDGASRPTAELPESWLWPFGDGYPAGLLPWGGTVARTPSGAFTISGIAPGRYVLQFGRDDGAQAAGWSPKSVRVYGQEWVDLPIDVPAAGRLSDVVVTLTDRTSELSGRLSDQEDRPRSDVTIVVFPADSRFWWTGTRRLRTARPDTAGRYEIRGLPAGEYLLAAVMGRMPAEPSDPGWLGGLAAQAVPILIAEGGRTVQDLRQGRAASSIMRGVASADGRASRARPAPRR